MVAGVQVKGKNEQAWERVFTALPILADVARQGYADVTADDLKKHGDREPRLMAKMDFRENRPRIMSEHGLAILAIQNGLYRIGPFDPFITIQDTPQTTPIKMNMPKGMISINPRHLHQESAVLDAALISGILADAFGEEVSLTIRGRTHVQPFTFHLAGVHFPINGVQVEVDGGYEGATSINLVEAKIGGRRNINLRQILYPHRGWEAIARASSQRIKTVRSFLCFYQSPIVRFIPVIEQAGIWTPNHDKEKCYLLETPAHMDIMSIQEQVSVSPPVDTVPFPQADRFDTILSMIVMTDDATRPGLDMKTIADSFDVVPRQIDYYVNAMKWLGLVEPGKGATELTPLGRNITAMSHAERIRTLAAIVFSEPLFHRALHHPEQAIPDALFTRWKLAGSTRARRLNTVHAWIRYFQQQTQT